MRCSPGTLQGTCATVVAQGQRNGIGYDTTLGTLPRPFLSATLPLLLLLRLFTRFFAFNLDLHRPAQSQATTIVIFGA